MDQPSAARSSRNYHGARRALICHPNAVVSATPAARLGNAQFYRLHLAATPSSFFSLFFPCACLGIRGTRSNSGRLLYSCLWYTASTTSALSFHYWSNAVGRRTLAYHLPIFTHLAWQPRAPMAQRQEPELQLLGIACKTRARFSCCNTYLPCWQTVRL